MLQLQSLPKLYPQSLESISPIKQMATFKRSGNTSIQRKNMYWQKLFLMFWIVWKVRATTKICFLYPHWRFTGHLGVYLLLTSVIWLLPNMRNVNFGKMSHAFLELLGLCGSSCSSEIPISIHCNSFVFLILMLLESFSVLVIIS